MTMRLARLWIVVLAVDLDVTAFLPKLETLPTLCQRSCLDLRILLSWRGLC